MESLNAPYIRHPLVVGSRDVTCWIYQLMYPT